MSEITIKIDGKDFQAKLSIDALERIEQQFDNMSLGQIMVTKQGIRSAKAILIACVQAVSPGAQAKTLIEAMDKQVQAEGIDSLWELVKPLVEASGFYGKQKAKEAALGN